MIVCLCLGLSERDVRDKLGRGAKRLEDIVPKRSLEENCGSCFQQLKAMIRDHQKKNQHAGHALQSPSENLLAPAPLPAL